MFGAVLCLGNFRDLMGAFFRRGRALFYVAFVTLYRNVAAINVSHRGSFVSHRFKSVLSYDATSGCCTGLFLFRRQERAERKHTVPRGSSHIGHIKKEMNGRGPARINGFIVRP